MNTKMKNALNGGNISKAIEIAEDIRSQGKEWVAVMDSGCFADNIQWICYATLHTDLYVTKVVTAEAGNLWK